MIDNGTLSPTRRTGHFAKGNPGGPGNPHGRQVAVIRSALLAALTPEVLKEIIARIIEHAVEGNMAAIKLLLGYAVGRPGKAEDLLAQLAGMPSVEGLCDTEGAETPEAPLAEPCPTVSAPDEKPSPTVATKKMERCDPPGASSAPPSGCGEREHRHQTANAARKFKVDLSGDRHQTVKSIAKTPELLRLEMGVQDLASAGVPLPAIVSRSSLVP